MNTSLRATPECHPERSRRINEGERSNLLDHSNEKQLR